MENNIIEITEDNFDEIIDTNKIVIVDFMATWCGPCKALAQTIHELGNEYKDNENVVIGKANIDECPELCSTFRIQSVPTVIFFVNSETGDRFVGNLPKENYKKQIEHYLKNI